METTTLKTFEISIPEKYVSAIRKLVKSMGGSVKIRKEKKCGLDEALKDVKAGRIYHAESTEDMMKQIFG
ncbi:hypothetical protein NXY11_15975 [Parabacteroides faecis]|uniref:hypothetical protein n=1 Tax=Parabacteroides faecis TaxID=1217282 RepID=UPI002164B9B8|nr:hypothetical protein [Parabacteroides faecis]MCS2891698.1 hypothetical protein [Parabacteroides faecis]UVQ44689.1 hypothetical protein NXY11_15975 [Parabacteroides faecis]